MKFLKMVFDTIASEGTISGDSYQIKNQHMMQSYIGFTLIEIPENLVEYNPGLDQQSSVFLLNLTLQMISL